jgi:hypothetical protein
MYAIFFQEMIFIKGKLRPEIIAVPFSQSQSKVKPIPKTAVGMIVAKYVECIFLQMISWILG